jgi:hypothetical protein
MNGRNFFGGHSVLQLDQIFSSWERPKKQPKIGSDPFLCLKVLFKATNALAP